MNFLYYFLKYLIRKRKIARINRFNKKYVGNGFHLSCPNEKADLISGVILVCENSCDYIRVGAISPFPDKTSDLEVIEFLFLNKIKLNKYEVYNITRDIGILGKIYIFFQKKVVYSGW